MAHPRLFRFGGLATATPTLTAWREQARRTEAQGFDILLQADHFSPAWFPPLLALQSAADATTTLRVGTYVLANDFRHPAVLAREAVLLDLLSDGRFELGLGAGYAVSDYQQSGIPFDPPGQRVGRLEEAAQIIKRSWSEDRVTFHGTHYDVTDLECSPKPTQQPHPPLLIAGAGRRMLTLAAREADIVGVAFNTAGRMQIENGSGAATAERIAWIKEAAGDRFAALELNTIVFHVVVTNERARVAEELARGWGCTAEELLDTINVLVGSVDEIVNQIQSWREHFGISYLVAVGSETMEVLAPVVGRLAGT